MPAPLALKLTDAGLAAVQAASGTDQTVIAELALTNTPFDYAPTLTALPGEFKRLPVTSGTAAAPNLTHCTVYDISADAWSATGFGLFLDDGTLFAVYTQAATVLSKVELAFALLAFDIAFSSDLAANIAFGDATFIYPPATEQMRGVARIATQARVDDAADGADDAETIVTPKTLRSRLSGLLATVNASINALAGRTITGGGLATGGGNLTADRVITVAAAAAADVAAGTATDKAITPAALSGLARTLNINGYAVLPGCGGLMIQWGTMTAAANTTSSATFPIAFPTACYSVVATGGVSGGADSQDNPPVLVTSTITNTGFSVFSADDDSAGVRWIAIGR